MTVLSAYRPGRRLAAALPALGPSATGELLAAARGGQRARGKFQNLNRALERARRARTGPWSSTTTSSSPAGSSTASSACARRTGLQLAQPAQTRRSHAAWRVTRRRPLSLARRTRFVEIGPVTAFARRPAAELLPFPDLRFGWGLDLHWAALAERSGWAAGVVDAHARPPRGRSAGRRLRRTPRPIGRGRARFLAGREYLPSERAQETLAALRR